LKRAILTLLALLAPGITWAQTNGGFTPGPTFNITSPTNNQTFCYNSATGWWANGNCGGGSGSVTSFSIVTANGFSGTVATATTTPALTINQLAASSLGAGALPSGVTTTAGGVPTGNADTGTLTNKDLSSDTNTIVLWAVGTGASSSGCSATSVAIGARADTKLGGGSFLSGISGTCTVVLTLPSVTHYWDCIAHDVTLQANFVMTAASATGCTISYSTQSGDLVTLQLMGS
jgi:hypothetical protein